MTGLLRVFHSLVFLAVVLTAGYSTLHESTAIGAAQSIESGVVVLGLVPEGDRSCPATTAGCAAVPALGTTVDSAAATTVLASALDVRRPATPAGRPRGRLPDPADSH